jgi:hypothetical protein
VRTASRIAQAQLIAGGAGEGREQAVTGSVDLAAADPVQFRPQDRIVGVQERPPLAVAQPRCGLD